MPYKTWANTEILYAADLNTHLMAQAVPRFATTGERDAAIGTPVAGQYCDVTGVGLMRHSGTVWVAYVPLPPGGTTGQVLAKTSGTDYAVGWVTP